MAEQDAQLLPDTTDDNAPPPPIEIDLESGETSDQVTPAPVTAPVTAPVSKPAIPRPQARIRELSEEVRATKSYAQQVEDENRRLREENAREKSEREKAERAGMENYASRVKSDLDSAAQELQRAEETNDVPGKVAAQTKLAKAAAAESDVDAWRASNPVKPAGEPAAAPQQQTQRPQQQAPQEQPLPPEVFNFVQENVWFDAYQRDTEGRILRDHRTGQPVGNPDFDEEMHDAAMLIDKKIQRQIKRGELPKNYSATDEYFTQIKSEMSAQFPELVGEGEPAPAPAARPRTPPMAAPRQPVAPANRSGMPGQNNGNRQGTKVTLTSEERQFVDGLVANGTLRYPRNHAVAEKRGQKMDAKDAYLEYAKRAQETRQNPQPQ